MVTREGNSSLRDGLQADDTKVDILAYSSCGCLDLFKVPLECNLSLLILLALVLLYVHKLVNRYQR